MASMLRDAESVADVKKQTPKEFLEVDADLIATAAVTMKKRVGERGSFLQSSELGANEFAGDV
eukprot:7194914-Pyramimonas_sp.AAC.1